MSDLWCRIFHRGRWFGNLLWNGNQGRWMNWCNECGDWRKCSRSKLEAKMLAIMKEHP